MRTIDWYFDFVSPFSYLQSFRLHELEALAHVRYRPVVFAGLLKHWQQLGPAEVAPKRTFTYRHVTWMAARDGIPFHFPKAHPFRSLEALRLVVENGSDPKLVHALFRYLWDEGGDPTDLAAMRAHVEARSWTISEAAKQELIANGEEAAALGVFGVPTFVVDGEIYWGYDATDFALAAVRDPAAVEPFRSRRFDDVGVAVTRRT